MRKVPSSPVVSRLETPQQFLERIFCELPHLDAMFLFQPDGVLLSHTAKEEQAPAALLEVAGALLEFAGGVARTVQQGLPQYLLLKNEGGCLLFMTFSCGHLLVVQGGEHVRPDVMQYSAQWISEKLAVLLAGERN